MKCRGCGAPDHFHVIDTRAYGDGYTTTRRLECACGRRWTTVETEKEGSAVMVDAAGHPLRVAAPTTGSPLPVAGGVSHPRQVAGQHQSRPLPVAAAPPPGKAHPLPVVGGGVGGGLSGDRSGSVPEPVSDPSVDPSQERDRARVWPAGRWLREFGDAWSLKFCAGARHYGNTSDGKACGELEALIAALPPGDVLAAQERAGAMFAEFFAERTRDLVKARHCFAFFVTRWGQLRVPAVPAVAPPPPWAPAPAPPRADPNCKGWHAGGKNTGRAHPRGQQAGCPECKSVYLRSWTAEDRPGQPTPVADLLPGGRP